MPANEIRQQSVTSVRGAQQAFGVNLVVTGSIQRADKQVRLIANLVDTQTIQQIASKRLDISVENISALQERVVDLVSEMLQLQLQPEARSIIGTGGTTVPGAYDFYLQGQGYLQRYEGLESVDHAINEFRLALQKDENYALAYAGLGEAYWRKSRITKDAQWIDEAWTNCSHSVKLNHRISQAYMTRGAIHRDRGRYSEAVTEFQHALNIDRVNPDIYRLLASTYESMGKFGDAEVVYRRAVQLRSGYWVSHAHLGTFYYRRGRYVEAENQFRTVIQLAPDNPQGYTRLGAVLHMTGRTDAAISMLQKSLTLKPDPDGYSNLGTILFFQGRYADAVPMFEKATGIRQRDYRLWGNLGDGYEQVRQSTKANDAYKRASVLAERQLKINPDDPAVLSSLGVYRAKLHDPDRAAAAIRTALKLAPHDTNVLFKSARVYEVLGDRNRALKAIEQALRGGYPVGEIKAEPDLSHLRLDARYDAILKMVPDSSAPDRTKRKRGE